MIKHFLAGLGFVVVVGATAQTVDLKGRVLDKANNKPIPGAAVKVQGSSLATTTDTAGRFRLTGSVSLRDPGRDGLRASLRAPEFSHGAWTLEAAAAGEARIEIFGLAGESLASARHEVRPGVNRFASPLPNRDFVGFARVTVGGESWVKRILRVAGHALPADRGAAAPSALAKRAAGNVEITMAKLQNKTVAYSADAADLGDIYMDYPDRKLDVGAAPIYGAVVLFDGTKGMAAANVELQAKWHDWARFTPSDIKFKLAKDPEFPSDTNRVTLQSCCNTLWGYDDIQAKAVHGDAQLHVEWIGMGQYDQAENPDIGPSGKGQPGYINSGVYVQSRYEVQIESQGVSDAKHDMASLVDDYAPTTWSPNRGNGKWQAYDITFRSARYNASGARTENARITVWWNGVKVHDNRDARAPATGLANHSGEELNATLYGLKLQSEGRDVRFRNIWIKHLELKEAKTDIGY